MNNTGKTLTALLLGAAAGAVAGLLMAPEAGTQMRTKLTKTGETIIDDINATWKGLTATDKPGESEPSPTSVAKG